MRKGSVPRRELAGSVFGRLTVVSQGPTERTSGGRAMTTWACLCECGQEMVVRTQALTSGNTSSCGCSRWQGEYPGYKSAHARVTRHRGSAKNKTCDCGQPAYDWSYNHDDPDEVTEDKVYPSGVVKQVAYSNNPDYYTARCRPCHSQMDKALGKERSMA